MTVAQVAELIETFAPLNYQEHYDNAGLCVGNAQEDVCGVLLCLDVSEAAIDEAIQKGCNLIVSHHPAVFGGLKQFTGATVTQRIVERAIRSGIALYAAHTNLDKVCGGVSSKMCEKLHLTDCRILDCQYAGNAADTAVGLGMIGNLEQPTNPQQFLQEVKKQFGSQCLRYNANYMPHSKFILRVAVCGGSGAALMPLAWKQNADAYVSADLKYHDFQGVEPCRLCIDAGHYESEIFALEIFFDILKKNTTFVVNFSQKSTNAIHYL